MSMMPNVNDAWTWSLRLEVIWKKFSANVRYANHPQLGELSIRIEMHFSWGLFDCTTCSFDVCLKRLKSFYSTVMI